MTTSIKGAEPDNTVLRDEQATVEAIDDLQATYRRMKEEQKRAASSRGAKTDGQKGRR